MTDRIPRTRFAPSPSGNLHIGGARTALFCWAYAVARGGTFILRIEDTDRRRSSDASSMGFLEDLAWMGIEWQEGPVHEGCGGGELGPYIQSERLELYGKACQQLLDAGLAYPAFETPEELAVRRQEARKEKVTYRYNRAALDLDPETVTRWIKEGKPHVIRFRVPDEGDIVVHDLVVGEVRTPITEIDDFVIRKADGYPTYHLAVVVDDALMGITHVIRAQEHLNNTARHLLLQRALGLDIPAYAHLSIIFNPDNSKMSKRDKDRVLRAAVRERGIESTEVLDQEIFSSWRSEKDNRLSGEEAVALAGDLGIDLPEIDVSDFRRAGYLPEVLVNYLALLGWSPGKNREQFPLSFFLEHFDLERLVKSPARFDREKLLAFNLDALQAMEQAEFAERLQAHCAAFHPEFLSSLSPETFALLASSCHERSKTLEDPVRICQFMLVEDDALSWEDTRATRKAMCRGEVTGFDILAQLLPALEAHEDWSIESLEAMLRGWADAHAQGRLGAIGQPLRFAVSGGSISPPLFETLAMLGPASVLCRIERCLSMRSSFAVS